MHLFTVIHSPTHFLHGLGAMKMHRDILSLGNRYGFFPQIFGYCSILGGGKTIVIFFKEQYMTSKCIYMYVQRGSNVITDAWGLGLRFQRRSI